MNRWNTDVLITYPGEGVPYKEGTANFLQDANKDILNSLARSLVNNLSTVTYVSTTPFCISGSAGHISGGTITLDEGWIYYQNEVWYAPASTAFTWPLSAGNDIVGTRGITYFTDPTADPVTLSDGITSYNVHEIHTITWSVQTLGSGDFSWLSDTVRLTNAITLANSINSTLSADIATIDAEIATLTSEVAMGAWTNLTLHSDWSAGSLTPQYRVDGIGRVYLRGNAVSAGGSTATLGTLPGGVRPLSNSPYFAIRALVSSAETVQLVNIDSTGVITFQASSFGLADVWNVDGITFLNT